MDNEKVNRKLTITLAFMVIVVLVFFGNYIFFVTHQSASDEQQVLKETETSRLKAVDDEAIDENTVSVSDPEARTIFEPDSEASTVSAPNPEAEDFMEDPGEISDGFSERMPDLFIQRRENVETFITREDLPEDLKQELDKSMEQYEKNGFLEIDDNFIEYMDAPYNEVVEFNLDDPSLLFVADNLEGSELESMEYIGIIPDRDLEAPGQPVPALDRVFKHEAGYLYLTEAGIEDSDAILQEEFVNQSVKGYPATQINYCAPSERCVTVLTWLTVNKRYELTLRGDIDQMGEDKLASIASSLNLPPLPTDSDMEK